MKPTFSPQDEAWMARALQLAERAEGEGEVPVGAVLVGGVATVAIFAFLNSWNEFLAALIFMTDQSNFTLPIFLTNVRSGLYGVIDWGALQAGVIISIIPSLVIFLLLQRYYMNGLMGGAVKS